MKPCSSTPTNSSASLSVASAIAASSSFSVGRCVDKSRSPYRHIDIQTLLPRLLGSVTDGNSAANSAYANQTIEPVQQKIVNSRKTNAGMGYKGTCIPKILKGVYVSR
jgi:hypothetical protein